MNGWMPELGPAEAAAFYIVIVALNFVAAQIISFFVAPKVLPMIPRHKWFVVLLLIGLSASPLVAKITIAGPALDGVEVTCDLPVKQRMRNTGGRDGAGLCVFTSLQNAARYQNERRLVDLQKDMRKEPGGGYPQKVDAMIARYGKGTAYLQYEGKDTAILKAALATGRMPSVTYDGHDPHYRGSIAHMVNLVHLDDKYAVVLDNNFIGEQELVWLSPEEFKSRWLGNGGGWAVVLLSAPPPPAPRN